MPKQETPAPDVPDLLTREEAAKLARVGLTTLKRWIAAGELPLVRLGSRVYVRRASLAAYVDAKSKPATSGPLAGLRG